MTQSTRCPYCGTQANFIFDTKDFNRRISDETFSYYKCPADGLIFLHPIPEDLGKYYLSDYYQVPTSIEQLVERDSWQYDRIEFVQQFVKSGKLLEIGPSYGAFSYFAKQAGYDVNTIEMDDDCCRFLEKVVEVPTIQSDQPHETLASLTETYDVIAMWQVIEHVSEPWKLLDACATHLSDGGILVIATPNPDSFQFRVLKSRWHHTDAPRHLSLISSNLLDKHTQSQGLTSVMFTTHYKDNLLFHNKHGWRITLTNLVSSKLGRISMRLIGAILARLISPIDQKQGNGSTYVSIYQKDTKA